MIPLLLSLYFTPAALATSNEPIVGYTEVCPGVFRVEVLIDNASIDTYYEPFTAEAYDCALRLEGNPQ